MNSMTGFGQASVATPLGDIRVEVVGVNRKQAELVVNLPKGCAEWDNPLRKMLAAAVSRGRVALSISWTLSESEAHAVHVDYDLLQSLSSQVADISDTLALPMAPGLGDLIRLNIVSTAKADAVSGAEGCFREHFTLIETGVRQAIDGFLQMRQAEGKNLLDDFMQRAQNLADIKARIAEHAPGVVMRYREALIQRIAEAQLGIEVEEERLLREVALFADKCDISEELVRLNSHFDMLGQLCSGKEPAGRPLDFLCQEIGREFNTIGSKANDATLSHLVVAGKTELEKLREQVQNVE